MVVLGGGVVSYERGTPVRLDPPGQEKSVPSRGKQDLCARNDLEHRSRICERSLTKSCRQQCEGCSHVTALEPVDYRRANKRTQLNALRSRALLVKERSLFQGDQVACSAARPYTPTGGALHYRDIGILLPNNQRQHRTLHIQKDVLPCALC